MVNEHIFAIEVKTQGHVEDQEIERKLFDLICKYKHEIKFDDNQHGQILEMRGLTLSEKRTIKLNK